MSRIPQNTYTNQPATAQEAGSSTRQKTGESATQAGAHVDGLQKDQQEIAPTDGLVEQSIPTASNGKRKKGTPAKLANNSPAAPANNLEIENAALKQSLAILREVTRKRQNGFSAAEFAEEHAAALARIAELEQIIKQHYAEFQKENGLLRENIGQTTAENIRLREQAQGTNSQQQVDAQAARIILLEQERQQWYARFQQAQAQIAQAQTIVTHLQKEKAKTAERVNARLSVLEQENATLKQEKAQAVTTVEELLSERRSVLAEDCDLLAVNREQAEQIEEKDRLISAIQRENAQYREALELREGMDAVSKELLSPSQKQSVLAAIKAIQRGTPDAAGRVEIWTQDLADATDTSADTIGTHLRRVNAIDILHYETEKVRDETGHVINTRCFIAPTPVTFQPREYHLPAADLKRKHGGIPPVCPHCRSIHLQKRVTITCLDCHKIISDTGDGSGSAMLPEPEDRSDGWMQEPEGQIACPVESTSKSASLVQEARRAYLAQEETPAPICQMEAEAAPERQVACPVAPEKTALWDKPCDHCGSFETIPDQTRPGHRICACWEHPEWREAYSAIQTPAREPHMVANLATNRVEEVYG